MITLHCSAEDCENSVEYTIPETEGYCGFRPIGIRCNCGASMFPDLMEAKEKCEDGIDPESLSAIIGAFEDVQSREDVSLDDPVYIESMAQFKETYVDGATP